MEFNNQIFNQTWFNEKYNLSQAVLYRRGSLERSSYSDSPKEYWYSSAFRLDAKRSIALLAVLPLFAGGRKYDQIDSLRLKIAKMASNYRLEGDWKLVGEILQRTVSLDIHSTWSIIAKTMTTNVWFGNFLPLMLEAVKALRLRTIYSSVTTDKRKVQYPKRKRGYDDKGSMTPSHKWLPKQGNLLTQEREKVEIVPKIPPRYAWWWRMGKGSG